MFKFEPAERCLYGGISPSVIGHSMRNEFLMNFGCQEIDYRVSVVITERNIQFFYYDGEEEIIDMQNARNRDKLKEVGAISLTNPKETGNDILRFPANGIGCRNVDFFRMSESGKGEKQSAGDGKADDKNNVGPILKSFQNQFYNFPFLYHYEDVKQSYSINKESCDKKNNGEYVFRRFIKCCLLAFVFEFEDRDECFSHSPIYDKVRESLRKSDVYNLLSAKIRYTLYVPKEGACYNAEEYTYRTRKFSDRLMNNRINKVIFHNDYLSKGKESKGEESNTCQGWFYNPEEELEAILEQNRRQKCIAKKTLLEDNLVLKIRNFLYTKHAVRDAMVDRLGKSMFDCGQWLMAISSVALLVAIISSVGNPMRFNYVLKTVFPSCIALFCVVFYIRYLAIDIKNLEKGWWNCRQLWIIVPLLLLFVTAFLSVECDYLFMWLSVKCFCGIVAFFVIIFIFGSGLSNSQGLSKKREGWSNVLMPRILVAELAAWLTIGIAEDLVKSMLWVSEFIALIGAAVLVALLIMVVVWGEIKQHSPYLSRFAIFKRDLVIINHSLFFALGIGMIMQFVFYDNLVKNSDVISSVVYGDYFDDANYYCQNLEELNGTLRQFGELTNTSSMIANVEMQGNNYMSAVITGPDDNDTAIQGRIYTRNSVVLNNRDIISKAEYNKYVNFINANIKEIAKLSADTIFPFLDIEKEFQNKLYWYSYFDFYIKRCGSIVCFRECRNDIITPFARNDSINPFVQNAGYLLDTLGDGDSNDPVIKERNKTIIESNKTKVNMLELYKEISNVRLNLSLYDDYDTLMAWSMIEEISDSTRTQARMNSGSVYLDRLTDGVKHDHQCWREVSFPSPWKFFPYLLIFHTLIVLVIAFVLQLLITDKTVTEPL